VSLACEGQSECFLADDLCLVSWFWGDSFVGFLHWALKLSRQIIFLEAESGFAFLSATGAVSVLISEDYCEYLRWQSFL